MLDPQYLQESTTENDDNLPGDSIPEELVKSEFPHVFGPPASPNSPLGKLGPFARTCNPSKWEVDI